LLLIWRHADLGRPFWYYIIAASLVPEAIPTPAQHVAWSQCVAMDVLLIWSSSDEACTSSQHCILSLHQVAATMDVLLTWPCRCVMGV
jgi:hypothetical protein